MTGEKSRFKTTEKLWDMDDKQLKTPKHDAMVLWLMDMDNLSSLIDFPEKMRRYDKYEDIWDEYVWEKNILKSEYPLYSNKNFLGGYIDILVYGAYRHQHDEYDFIVNNYYNIIEVKPYIDSFGAVLRQMQSYIRMVESTDYHGNRLNFNSDADRGYCLNRTFNYHIFTLDDRFDAQFKSQMINVLHPPQGISINDMMKQYGLIS